MIAAGGTGGHVYPALAVAEAIAEHYPGTKQFFVGSVDGFERPLVEKEGINFDAYDEVRAGPLHGVKPLRALSSSVQHVMGVGQALGLMRRHRPDVLLLTGGWISLPVAVAAWLVRVPILIFLPDIEPGLAIKVLQRIARRVAIAIPESKRYFGEGKTVVTGYPIRAALTSATRDKALTYFNLDPNCKTLLVFGGSRGAQTINSALIEILPRILDDGVQVIHVTGTLDWERVIESVQSVKDHPHYHPKPYLHDDMGLALASADLVVSRSGAAILGEFPLFAVPSILVPYPFAWRYQKVNADYLVERGAGICLPDEQMTQELYPTIHRLFTNEEQLATMRGNVEKLAQPEGARRVAMELVKLAGKGPS